MVKAIHRGFPHVLWECVNNIFFLLSGGIYGSYIAYRCYGFIMFDGLESLDVMR